MLFAKSKKPNLTAINSFIAKDVSIEGDITFTGALKIAGDVSGGIFKRAGVYDAPATVIIEGLFIGGAVEADHVVITGRVKAKKVVARESLIVIAGGKLESDEIFYGALTSDETSSINGKLERIVDEDPAEEIKKV